MKIGEICTRDVVAVGPDEALAKAAQAMFARNVGSVVVVDSRDGAARPVGMITDRDLIRGQLDRKADLFCLSAGDVMTSHPLVLHEDCDVVHAVELMSGRGVRRVPVVGKFGELVGIVSFDDLLPVLAGQMTAVARLIGTRAESCHPKPA
jgi:CBS domain-containing protein